MTKYSDTTLFRLNSFSDTTKQVKRAIYESVLDTGFAPKISDISKEFELSKPAVDEILHDLEGGIIIALQNSEHADIHEFMGQELPEDCILPEVGEIFYARPFANFKNHHQIYVDGEQKWYGECPVECMTISYFFPDKDVIVKSIAHDSKETVEIVGRNGRLLDYSPKSLRVFWGRPFGDWIKSGDKKVDFIFPCDTNYFFSSEASFQEWKKTNPTTRGQSFTPDAINRLLRMFNYGHERFDYQYHIPLLRLLLGAIGTGMITLNLLIPLPNPFFLSIIKLARNARKAGYKFFLDIKLW
ncbi:MAG: organomercurial lyase [Desulfobacterales bacterium]